MLQPIVCLLWYCKLTVSYVVTTGYHHGWLRLGTKLCMVQAQEALRRAKFKFPGRQKIVESRNWGFTPFNREDYVEWKQEGRVVNCGVHAQVRTRFLHTHVTCSIC